MSGKITSKRLFPVIIGACAMAGTLILWHALNARERSLIERTVESRVMDSYLPEVTLIAGILISLMLAWIYHIQASRRREKSGLQILSTAVEQSPVSVMITDVKGNIEYVNPHFTAVAGYSPEEAAGKNPRILKSGLQGREFYRDLWTTITSGREWTGEFHNKKKNGELYWEKAKISP
ncbi:MAG TPA: PAS domain S-box protein, partial [Thermodesulfobacteriota bacterium]|nr:PAS domain S-box protein [Thermodesulfobacteriota bacterium]